MSFKHFRDRFISFFKEKCQMRQETFYCWLSIKIITSEFVHAIKFTFVRSTLGSVIERSEAILIHSSSTASSHSSRNTSFALVFCINRSAVV